MIEGAKWRRWVFFYIPLGAFVFILLFPLYWMLITTFKQTSDLYNLENDPFIFNARPTLEHLHLLFFETRYLRWLGNTALVGIIVVAITLVLALPAAYALARLTGVSTPVAGALEKPRRRSPKAVTPARALCDGRE